MSRLPGRAAAPLLATLLATLLSGCASPQAELEDAVADLTDAANARSAGQVLDDANTVISLAEAQRDRLGDRGADRIVGLARMIGARSELLEVAPTPPPAPVPTTRAPAPETEEPEPEPEPTEESTPVPTEEPTQEPDQTQEPDETPEPTQEPEPTRPPATVAPGVPLPTRSAGGVPTRAAAGTQAPAAGLTGSGGTPLPSPTGQART